MHLPEIWAPVLAPVTSGQTLAESAPSIVALCAAPAVDRRVSSVSISLETTTGTPYVQ
ncbi:hypothetical protein MB901379_00807 [Mycobacterium basiliense]|uniref:Uncharacterized protein n=1 Tax=Mycobacterium basiliense TaxID=2094119 RepID=A0A3S4CT87_9MYCO|nr:hypothetical protein MB901379_00807 [Mycobacterium basiliense]